MHLWILIRVTVKTSGAPAAMSTILNCSHRHVITTLITILTFGILLWSRGPRPRALPLVGCYVSETIISKASFFWSLRAFVFTEYRLLCYGDLVGPPGLICRGTIWGLCQDLGYLFGRVPITRIMLFGGLCWVPLFRQNPRQQDWEAMRNR